MTTNIQFQQYNKDNIMRALGKMVPPMAIQGVLTAVVSATDAIMLGVLNQQALTAVTLASQLMQIFSYMILALGVGTTALSAQYWGKKEPETVGRVLHISLRVSLMAGTLFMIACLAVPNVIMSFYSGDDGIIELGATYLRYVGIAFFFMGFSQIYMIIMKNTGHVLESSVFGTITIVLNIILDGIFIFGLLGCPKMGVAGAALATAVSRGVEFVLTLLASKKKSTVTFNMRMLFKTYRGLKRKFWRYTFPSVIQLTSWIVATSVTVAILGHLSSEVVAAAAVALIVYNIAGAITIAYGNSVGIILGQQLGAGDIDEAKTCGDKMLKNGAVLGLILGVVVCIIAPVIPRITVGLDLKARDYLFWMIIIMGAKCIGRAINTTLSTGVFSAGGDIKFLMKLDIINMWLIIVPAGLIAAFLLKCPPLVVYIIVNMDEYTKMYTEVKHYRKYLWAKNLTKKEWADPGKYEKELRETIVERIPVGAMVLGSSGRITMSNPAAERILGMSQWDLRGEPLTIFTLEDERNLDFNQCILDAVYDKTNVNNADVDFYVKDECRKLRVSTSFVEEEDANIGVLILINQR